MISRWSLVLILVVLSLPGCKKNSILPYSDFGGSWIGEFKMQYEYRSPADYNSAWKSGNTAFNITIEFADLAPLANGIAVLTITYVRINDPFFGCEMGVTPSAGSVATLEYPAEHLRTQPGIGLVILLPNGTQLLTNNALGALHMSQSRPYTISNSNDPGIQPVNSWNNTVWYASDAAGRSYEAYRMGWDNTTTAVHFNGTQASWIFTQSNAK